MTSSLITKSKSKKKIGNQSSIGIAKKQLRKKVKENYNNKQLSKKHNINKTKTRKNSGTKKRIKEEILDSFEINYFQ